MTEDRLNSIARQLAALEQQKEALISERETLLGNERAPIVAPQTLPPDQKVKLFMSLFKGRTDIFAQHWQNTKGRSGYSVACENEWASRLCNKPKIKCMDCSNQRFKPVNEHIIYQHLTGKKVIGLYPLLQDNTCQFLAIDFDKSDWKEAVSASIKACHAIEVPYAVEISRPCQGAHLWVFMSEPVPAKDARQLGFAILDKAMELYPHLSFDSYDRLFPSQDILPEGGFGNLIALPLQFQARKQGNTEFVESSLQPYQNQWRFLNELKTISPKSLNKLLLNKASNTNKLRDEYDDNEMLLPWEKSAKVEQSQIAGTPKTVSLTLANHIYIEIDDLPTPLVAQLRRLASFSNPVFFKTQAMRFSTHGIPRYISCARIENGPVGKKWLSLPRGCYDDTLSLLKEQKITPEIDDKRNEGDRLVKLKFLGVLRKNQLKAVAAITKNDTGVLHAPTAFGKTVTAIGVIKKRKVNTLILTHSKQLLGQWQERLQAFLEGVDIGVFHGGKKKPSGQIDIATYQSLINKKDNSVSELVQDYGQVVIDECHHISAPSFEMVLNEVRAKYVLGLTATPYRQDGHQKIIFMVSGPIRHNVKATHSDSFEQKVIVNQLHHQPPEEIIEQDTRPKISDVYNWIMTNQVRSEKIVTDIIAQISLGKHPLALTERRQHAEELHRLLVDAGINSVVLRGGMSAKNTKQANDKLIDAQVIVATGKYIGEGFDLPRLDTLFLAMPVAWKGSLAQYAGRIHRESEGKEQVTIFDYVDASLPMLQRMFKKREKGYKLIGYKIKPTSGDYS